MWRTRAGWVYRRNQNYWDGLVWEFTSRNQGGNHCRTQVRIFSFTLTYSTSLVHAHAHILSKYETWSITDTWQTKRIYTLVMVVTFLGFKKWHLSDLGLSLALSWTQPSRPKAKLWIFKSDFGKHLPFSTFLTARMGWGERMRRYWPKKIEKPALGHHYQLQGYEGRLLNTSTWDTEFLVWGALP